MRLEVKVIRNSAVTYKAEFDSTEEADAFIDLQEGQGNFGVPEHQELVAPAEYDSEGVLISEAVYETVPADYTIVITDITVEYEREQAILQKEKEGVLATQVSQRVLNYIQGENIQRELTTEQLTTMKSQFSLVDTALRNNMPGTAKTLIENLVVDGTLVTQEMKDNALQILENYTPTDEAAPQPDLSPDEATAISVAVAQGSSQYISPDGSIWRLSVDDAGHVVRTKITPP